MKPNQKEIIIDSELLVKKSIECKKYSKIVRVLKELFKAIIITKHILDLEVNLTVGKLLVFTLAIEK